jgi:hypothetical protein
MNYDTGNDKLDSFQRDISKEMLDINSVEQ